MNAPLPAVLRPSHDAVLFDPKKVALIRRSFAKDANDDEFSIFIEMCRATRLDPIRRQAYCFIYNKDDPKKRQMVLVTAISGFRTIAARTGDYRPDEDATVFHILPWKASRDQALIEMRAEAEKLPIKDRKAYLAETMVAIDDLYPIDPINPEGIEKAVVRLFKFSHGEWHVVTDEAYWSERAPIKDEWAWDDASGKRRPTGRQTLDTSGQWGKMPRVMLAKVAEASALRKAWPDDLSNVFAEEEVDRQKFIDLSPAEMSDLGTQQARLERVEVKDCLLIWWNGDAAEQAENVPIGRFADRALAYIEDHADEPSVVLGWKERNRQSLRTFFALHKSDALAISRRIEECMAPQVAA